MHTISVTARSEEQHIDDVDASQLPQQDVLTQPWSSTNHRHITCPAQESLPEPVLNPISRHTPAIHPSQNTFTSNSNGQDVHNSLSAAIPGQLHPSSPAFRNGQFNTFESSALSTANHNGSLSISSTRLRTHLPNADVTLQLAAHYGIPTKLPPLPRLNSNSTNNNRPPVPRFNESAAPSSTAPIAYQYPQSVPDTNSLTDFQSLMTEYIKMLNDKSEESGGAPAPAAPSSPAKTAAQLQSTRDEATQNFSNMLFGEFFGAMHYLEEYPVTHHRSSGSAGGANDFTSPAWDEFLTSPFIDDNETPFESFLETPAAPMISDSFHSPLVADAGANAFDATFDDMPLMAQPDDFSKMSLETAPTSTTASGSASPVKPPVPNFDGMYTIPPATPALEPSSVQDTPFVKDASVATPNPSASGRKKKTPTGTRKNATPETLVPLEAPTQPRNYVVPSVTSRKAVPAVFARKRSRSAAFDVDEEDELAGSDGGSLENPINQAEADAIAAKRRQNTLAARRSRKRKLEYQRELEDGLENVKREKDMWKERAMMLRVQVMQLGLPDPFREV